MKGRRRLIFVGGRQAGRGTMLRALAKATGAKVIEPSARPPGLGAGASQPRIYDGRGVA